MDKYLITTPPNLIPHWNNLICSNNRRSSLSLSQSAKKNKLSTPQSVNSIKSIRYSIAGAVDYLNHNYPKTNSRDALIKKYLAVNDITSSNDVSSKTRLSPKNNHSEMSLLVDDIENISPASPLAQSLSQLTMENSPKETGTINFNGVTPKQNPCFDKIKRDLNSPSATVRLRALHALKSPSKIQNYYGYDIPTEEIDIITEEERKSPEKPKSIQEIMKDVVIYVEVRNGVDNRSAGIKNIMHMLGATVNDKLLRNTTHVIFKDGLLSTYNKAKRWNIPLVSILWVEACKKFKRLMNPKYYPISDIDKYENPDMKKIRKYKSMQPDVDDIIKSSKMVVNKNVEKISELESDDSDEVDDVFQPQSDKKQNRKNLLDDSIKNCDEIIKSISNNLQHLSQKSDASDTSSGIFVQNHNQTDKNGNITISENDSNVTTRRSRRTSSVYSSIINKDCSTPIQEKKTSTKRMTTFVENMQISADETLVKDPENKTDYALQSMEESNKLEVQIPTSANRSRILYKPKYDEVNCNELDRILNTPVADERSPLIQNRNRRRTIIGLSKPTPKSNIFNPHLDISIEQQLDETKKTLEDMPVATSSVKRRRTLYTPQSYSVEANVADFDKDQVDSESKKNKEKELSKLIAERKKLRRSLFPLSASSSANLNDDKCNLAENKSEKSTDTILTSDSPGTVLTLPTTGAIKKRKLFTSGTYNDALSLDKTLHDVTPKKSPTPIRTPVSKTKITTRRSTMEFDMNKPKLQTIRPAEKTALFSTNRQCDPIMVVTNMHKKQIDVVKEAIKNLGRFKLEQAVTDRTTHLVSLEPRRTINMLRGIIRGVWILSFDWIIDSVNSNNWLHEEFYELKNFSKAIQLCRTERQAFEGEYKIDLFQDIEPIFISPKSTIPIHYLRELIRTCSGRWTDNIMKARYVVGEKLQNENVLCINPLWILDSIQENKIMKISKYVLRYDNIK